MPSYDSGTGRTLADLMYQRGNREAAMHLQRGDDQARMWGNAGNIISNAVQGWQQSVERNRQAEREAAADAERRQLTGMQLESASMDLDDKRRTVKGRETVRNVLPFARRADGVYGYDREKIATEMEAAGQADMLPELFSKLDEQEGSYLKVQEARVDAIAGDAWRVLQSGGGDEETVEAMLDLWEGNNLAPKNDIKLFRKAMKDQGPERALMAAVQSSPRMAQQLAAMQKANAPDLQAFKPGDVVVDKRNLGAGPVLEVPAEPKQPTSIEDAILQAERAGDTANVQRLLGMKKDIAAAGRAPAAPRAEEPLQAIIGENGQPVLVPRSQAVGKQPASNREVGRQVTSGDAGRIAEFNTALDDVATLTETLKGNKATGTWARLGAAVDPAITEATGFGAKAKQKQAVIDRVKQVIGKALEGGVLRKEDELKYEKILPTIKDTPEVVETKLNGLRTAIELRQQRTVEALEDAGYDTSKFNARAPGAGGAVKMRTPDGREINVPAAQVDEAKRRGATVVG